MTGEHPARRRAPRSAADYVEVRAAEMGFILGDVTEHLGSAIQHWSLASSIVRDDPGGALTHLVEAEIDLDIFARSGVAAVLRATRAATGRLDRELPDDEDEVAAHLDEPR